MNRFSELRSLAFFSMTAFVILSLLISLLAWVEYSVAAPATRSEVQSDPHYKVWRQSLLKHDAQLKSMQQQYGNEMQCGGSDETWEMALEVHQKRLELIEALVARDLQPIAAPPGVSPWPWGPATRKSSTSLNNFDQQDTAILFADNRLLFVNNRGVQEVDPFIASRVFYDSHHDEYDFLLLFTNFNSDLFSGAFLAYHLPIANDIEGIGYRLTNRGELFDDRQMFMDQAGNGRLASFIHMNNINGFPDSVSALYWRTQTGPAMMAHEIGHRWSARLGLWLPLLGATGNILGRGLAHWSFFANSDGSVLEGNKWTLNGTNWESSQPTSTYGDLDMYMMGLLHPNDIQPDGLFYLTQVQSCNPSIDLRRNPVSVISPPQDGVICDATRFPFTMDNIFMANGARRPTYPQTQRQFKVGTVLVANANRAVTPQELNKITALREALASFFFQQTRKRGSLHFNLTSIRAHLDLVHRAHGNVEDANQPIRVRLSVQLRQRSLPTTLDDVSLSLNYSINSSAFTSLPMTRDLDDSFFADIPAQAVGTDIRYFLLATTGPSNVSLLPPEGESHAFSFRVTPDATGPTIEHVARRRHSQHTDPILIRALIRDNHDVANSWVEFGPSNGPRQQAPLQRQGISDIFEARVVLPGVVGDVVDYRILATDVALSAHTTSYPASGFNSISITREQVEDAERPDPLWTHRALNIDSPDEWHREPHNHTPGGNWSWKVGPDNISTFPNVGQIALEQDAVLESPAIRLRSDWEFSFWHRYYFRLSPPDTQFQAVDGSIVECQDIEILDDVANDRWFLIDPIDGYTGQLLDFARGNPLQNYPVFGGTQGSWKRAVFNNSNISVDLTGHLLRFRFHVATSGPLARTEILAGWYIDDIVLDPGTVITPTLLQSTQAQRVDDNIRLSWTLSEVEGGDVFKVYRSSVKPDNSRGTFENLATLQAIKEKLSYEFVDQTANLFQSYVYQLGIVVGGEETLSREMIVAGKLPTFALHQNYPNPFNPVTEIRFELSKSGRVSLQIFDVQGHLVRSLVRGNLEMGAHRITWNGRDEQGQSVASGIYWYQLRSDRRRATHRMVLLR